jgi:hypothetical protein
MTTGATAPTVVYIGGAGRSGSTLLDNLLGSSPGCFSAGELRLLWHARQLWTHRCGCGRLLRECELWTAVLADVGDVDLAWAGSMHDRVLRSRQAWRLLSSDGLTRVRGGDTFVRLTGGVVQAIARVAGADVIVDSSKSPMGVALLRAAGVKVVAVQLVRDPRAIAWSWRRSSGANDELTPFSPRSVPATTLEWLGNNLAMEMVARRLRVPYLRVRYEELVEQPAGVLSAIAALAGVEAHVPLRGSTATLAPNHTVAGNPSRFRTGEIELRRDDEWRTRLTPRDRVVTTSIALPLLSHYGYSLNAS